MLEVKDIASGYGNIEIVHGVSMTIKQSSIACLIGPNGSGKSTIFKTIFGLIKPRRGTIIFDRQDITNLPPNKIVKRGLSYIPQGRSVLGTLTVEENLEMGAFIRNDKHVKGDMEKIYNLFPILKVRRKIKSKLLSGGEQQMLSIGRALMLHPKAILLDEPSLGLAPKVAEDIFRNIQQINEQGTTLLLIEQNARKALEISSYAYVLDLGRIRYEGSSRDVLENREIQKLYLGG